MLGFGWAGSGQGPSLPFSQNSTSTGSTTILNLLTDPSRIKEERTLQTGLVFPLEELHLTFLI